MALVHTLQLALLKHKLFNYTPQIFNQIQVWVLAQPLQNINLFLMKPFFVDFGICLGHCDGER